MKNKFICIFIVLIILFAVVQQQNGCFEYGCPPSISSYGLSIAGMNFSDTGAKRAYFDAGADQQKVAEYLHVYNTAYGFPFRFATSYDAHPLSVNILNGLLDIISAAVIALFLGWVLNFFSREHTKEIGKL